MFVATILCTAGASSADDPYSFTERWRWVHFTTQDGLPSDRILDVCEAQDGTSWVSTASGLAWYDGYIWHALGPEEGLPRAACRRITADRGSGILTVVDGKLYRGDRKRFEQVFIPGEGRIVLMAVPSVHGGLLLMSRSIDSGGPLYHRLAHGRLAELDGPQGADPFAPEVPWGTSESEIWTRTAWYAHHLASSTWHTHTSLKTTPEQAEAEADPRRSGFTWVEFPPHRRGLWSWHEGERPKLSLNVPLGSLRAVAEGPKGLVLAAENSGPVHARRGGTWSSLDPIPHHFEDVSAMRFRSNGDLWIGTYRGLSLYRATSQLWNHWRNPAAGSTDQVNEIMQAGDGTVWIASSDGVEIRQPAGQIERLTEIAGIDVRHTTGVAEDGAGNIWITSGWSYDGAIRFDGEAWTHFGAKQGLPGFQHKVRIDRQGRPWFLGLSPDWRHDTQEGTGAAVYTGDQFEHWTTTRGLIHDRVYAFAEGLNGELWFGTMGGLSRWHAGAWSHWTHSNGLREARIWTLAVDEYNQVWFADGRYGLGTIRDGEPHYITTADGLPSDRWHDIRTDPLGGIWSSCDGAVMRIKDDHRFVLCTAHGIGRSALWPILPTRDRVFIGTLGAGTTILDRAMLESCSLHVELAEPILHDESATMRWHAVAREGLISPQDVETRYRAENGAWSDWSMARFAHIRVAPGTHDFTVQARSRLAESPPTESHVSFTIPLPLFRQPMVIIPIVAGAVVIGGLVSWMAIRRRRDHAELHESEARFQQLACSIYEVFWLVDVLARKLIYVSPAYEQVFGRPPDRLYHCSPEWDEAILDEDRGAVTQCCDAAVQGLPFVDEYRIARPDGSVRWICDRGFPIRDENGEVTRYAGIAEDVTERKLAEAELQEKEARQASILDSVPMALYTALPSGNFAATWVSDDITKIAGFPAEQFTNDPSFWGNRMHPDDRARVFADFDSLSKHGMISTEYRWQCADGSYRWFLDHATLIRDEAGDAQEIIGTWLDNTKQKLAEGALRASEAEIRAIVDTAVDGIITIDEEGTVLSINPAAEKLFSYSPGEVMGRDIKMLMPFPYRERHAEGLKRFRETGEKTVIGTGLEVRGRRKDGSTFPLRVAVGEVRVGERRMFVGQLHDLTRQEAADQALQHAHDQLEARVVERTAELTQANRTLEAEKAALRENRARLAEAQRIARLGHWDYDVQADELVWSDEVYRIFGLDPQKFGATYEAFLDAVHPDDRQAVKKANAQALYHHAPYSIEHRVLRPDGTELIVHEEAEVTYDEHGRPTRMLGTVQDITERLRGARERATLKEQLHQSQKMEAVGQLAAGIAHDFNNLLMVMLGRCEQAKDMLPDQCPALEPLTEAEKAALKARDLTDSLLTFSRRMPAKKEPLNLCDTVEQSCKMIRHTLPPGVSLELSTCTPSLWITGDTTRVHQLLLNLAINARDAMADGGTLTIELCPASDGDIGSLNSESQLDGTSACLTVRDTGHGMSPEVVSHALEPFYTTKPRGRGTGLGLSIAHGIVEEHGGTLHIESEVGTGSVFTVVLPCCPREESLPILEASSSPIASGRGKSVLLISENSQERAILSSMLQAHAFTVVKADSLEHGIGLLGSSKPHLDLMVISTDGAPERGLDRLKAVCDNCSSVGVIVIVDDGEDESANPIAQGHMLLQRPFLMSDLARLASFVLQNEPRKPEDVR